MDLSKTVYILKVLNWRFEKCVLTGVAVDPASDHNTQFRIDFNKLVANTAKYSTRNDGEGENLAITMEGDDGAVSVTDPLSEWRSASVNHLRIVYTHTDMPQRKVNAFGYFLQTFCPGKSGF